MSASSGKASRAIARHRSLLYRAGRCRRYRLASYQAATNIAATCRWLSKCHDVLSWRFASLGAISCWWLPSRTGTIRSRLPPCAPLLPLVSSATRRLLNLTRIQSGRPSIQLLVFAFSHKPSRHRHGNGITISRERSHLLRPAYRALAASIEKPIPGRKAHGRSRISSARRKPTIFDAVSRLDSATATRPRTPGIAGE
jgi:hypothetical protein